MHETIEKCRICRNQALTTVLNLGEQSLTGRFPKTPDEKIEVIPLELVKCDEQKTPGACGLLQLRHTGDLSEMYGQGYGYRSSLNPMMVQHLSATVRRIEHEIILKDGDLVIDIGSNDATTLKQYANQRLQRIGVDPCGDNFKGYYPDNITLIADFFSNEAVRKLIPEKKARVVTSFSMFYDLEDPGKFMREVFDILEDGGIWVFEQSYMPTMLKMNSYDTICHEHLEYYGLRQIKWMTDRVGFKIRNVDFNDVNGGSFVVTVEKSQGKSSEKALRILQDEVDQGLDGLKPYYEFAARCEQHRSEILNFFDSCKKEGQLIIGYGASTKGNVLLQYCGIGVEQMPFIAEVNEDKFGCYTPGTLIPIISEREARAKNPNGYFVLPWHFRKGIVSKEKDYLNRGGRFIFPLPHLEVERGDSAD